MANMLNDATKIVFSRTRRDVAWHNASLRRELDPSEIEALKDLPGNDIMVFGSGSIVSQLTQRHLIDEYRFVVSPIILGSGRSLIEGVSNGVALDLLEARGFPSGNVLLRYRAQQATGW